MVEFQGIVRLAGKDIKGELKLVKALSQIKGIGLNLADSIAIIASEKLGINVNEKVGNLSQEQLQQVEDIIYKPLKYGIPTWVLDRRVDPETGENEHLIMSDMSFRISQDIQKEKDMKSYRGIRHMFGHKCRGQRTRNTGRKGRTLGVVKKKELPKTAPGKGEKPAKESKKK